MDQNTFKALVACVAIAAVAGCTVTALMMGHNGALYMSSLTAIGTILGYVFGKYRS